MSEQFVYLAGPISGLSFNQATDWRTLIKNSVPSWIKTLSPLRGKDYLSKENSIADAYPKNFMSTAKAITTRDFNDVKRSGVVLVNFLGTTTKISIGTVMEIAWAKVFNIPVICVIDNSGLNVHEHAMINECVNFKVNNIDDAIDILVKVLGDDAQVEAYMKKVIPVSNPSVDKVSKNFYTDAIAQLNKKVEQDLTKPKSLFDYPYRFDADRPKNHNPINDYFQKENKSTTENTSTNSLLDQLGKVEKEAIKKFEKEQRELLSKLFGPDFEVTVICE